MSQLFQYSKYRAWIWTRYLSYKTSLRTLKTQCNSENNDNNENFY